MGSGNDSILDMYLYETNTLLEQLDEIVLSAERLNQFSQDDVNEIFRIMHTIKGSSAMMEFGPIMTIAHRVEDLFFIIREKTMDVVPEQERPTLFDLMFQAVDYFRGEIQKIENDQSLSEDIDTFLKKINSFIAKIQNEKSEDTAPQTENAQAADQGAEGADAAFRYVLQVFFDEGCGMENLRAFMLVTSIKDFCKETEFTYSPQGVEEHPEMAEELMEHGFMLAFRQEEDRAKAILVVTNSGWVRTYQLSEMVDAPAHVEETAVKTDLQTPPAPTSVQAQAPVTVKNVPVSPTTGQQHGKESLISVGLSKLDDLIAVVGEIVITQSMVTASPDLKGLKLDNFNKSARQLRKLTDTLQDVSMSLRMVPVSSTFQKMNRIVRDMGKKLGRPATLTLIGEETEVDKTIVDSIGDPIMHIIRNSMDHGIEETQEERIAAGKDPVGEITLAAWHTGSEVIIQVKDDGRGVDCDAVLAKARKKGLANPDVEYSQKEILNFLIMPGFSTNVEVTEFSGRGVGMDVVKKNVEDVGGTVSISSELGKGMTTTLKIPLTMAIMEGMEVSVGNSIFTIPISNIRQSFKVGPEDIIHDAAKGEIIKCMDQFYPIVRVKDFFHLPGGRTEIQDGILMWVESGEQSYCLFVDELLGAQQVVVKPLPGYVNSFNIKRWGITGCTILGDGNISIILDVANIHSAIQSPGC